MFQKTFLRNTSVKRVKSLGKMLRKRMKSLVVRDMMLMKRDMMTESEDCSVFNFPCYPRHGDSKGCGDSVLAEFNRYSK